MGINSSDPKAIGKRIVELRKDNGLSQKDLAKKLGTKSVTLNQWENGTDNRHIKSDIVIAIANEFNVDCDFILRGMPSKNVALSREYGGLSNTTLETIKSFHSKPSTLLERDNIKRLSRINTVNALFENIEIFDLIHSFLTLDMKMFVKDFGKCKVVIEPEKPTSDKEKQIDTDLSLEDISLGLFFKIQQALISLRDKYNSDEEEKTPATKLTTRKTKTKEQITCK